MLIPLKEITPANHGHCVESNLCFRTDHKWSCDTGICYDRGQNQKLEKLTGIASTKCNSCRPLNSEVISSICSSKKIIAAKTIRLCDTEQIMSLIKKHPDLKVIILYRDPRGIYGSRKPILGQKWALTTVTKTCRFFHQTINFIDKCKFNWNIYSRWSN